MKFMGKKKKEKFFEKRLKTDMHSWGKIRSPQELSFVENRALRNQKN